MIEEVWKDVIEYEGHYQVSSLGNIKSIKFSKEKILKPCFDSDGYTQVGLCKNGIPKTRKVHQLVAESFLNHIPCGIELVVNHKNFIKHDNRLENLEVITNAENARHKDLSKKISNYMGVSYVKKHKNWKCQINTGIKKVYLGTFNTEEEASEYYQNALISIKNGTEIIVKRKEYTSKYKGVYWRKSIKKWCARININKQRIHLGVFDLEIEAHNAYQEKLKKIQNATAN
jgi:hypothetical protein